MANNKNAPRDDNAIPTAVFAQQGATQFVAPGQIDQLTGRILVDVAGGSGATVNRDVFLATNNQTVFTSTKTVTADQQVTESGSTMTPANTAGATVDYTVSGNVLTLSVGVPAGTIVIWWYT